MKIKIFIILLCSVNLFAQTELTDKKPAEKKLGLDQKILLEDDSKGIDTLFKNMIVVQKKAVERKNKFVLDTHFSFDFSDNPKTMYCGSLGVGYAFAENLEVGLSFAPLFMSSERATVKAVRQLTLENGSTADLVAPNPKWEAAGSVVWVFAYGKDAFGPYSIVRSDTFLKLFYSKVQYSDGFSGSRMGLFLGKTFLMSKYFNFRLSAGFAQQKSFINQKSQSTMVGLIEPGFVWFL